jgi:hypothetical protein
VAALAAEETQMEQLRLLGGGHSGTRRGRSRGREAQQNGRPRTPIPDFSRHRAAHAAKKGARRGKSSTCTWARATHSD